MENTISLKERVEKKVKERTMKDVVLEIIKGVALILGGIIIKAFSDYKFGTTDTLMLIWCTLKIYGYLSLFKGIDHAIQNNNKDYSNLYKNAVSEFFGNLYIAVLLFLVSAILAFVSYIFKLEGLLTIFQYAQMIITIGGLVVSLVIMIKDLIEAAGHTATKPVTKTAPVKPIKKSNKSNTTYLVELNGNILYTCYSLEEANNYVNTFTAMNGYTIDSEIVEIKSRPTKTWEIVVEGAGTVEIVSNIPSTIEVKISNVFITVATKPKAEIYGDYTEVEIKQTKIFSGQFDEAKKFADDWVANNAPALAGTWVVNDQNHEEMRLKVSEFTLPDGTVKRNFIEIQQQIQVVENN